jgi:hypothetical protein
MRLFKASALLASVTLSVASNAAVIINPTAAPASSLVSADLAPGTDLINNGPFSTSSSTAYIFNEGAIGTLQTFLLFYDKNAEGAYQSQTAGSFEILLNAGETFLGYTSSMAGLLSTDPANGVNYQTSPGSFATVNRGLEADDKLSVAVNGNLVKVNYSFVNGNPFAADNTRFSIGKSAVPEASTWSMLIFGFGVVGASMRRRKKVALAAA